MPVPGAPSQPAGGRGGEGGGGLRCRAHACSRAPTALVPARSTAQRSKTLEIARPARPGLGPAIGGGRRLPSRGQVSRRQIFSHARVTDRTAPARSRRPVGSFPLAAPRAGPAGWTRGAQPRGNPSRHAAAQRPERSGRTGPLPPTAGGLGRGLHPRLPQLPRRPRRRAGRAASRQRVTWCAGAAGRQTQPRSPSQPLPCPPPSAARDQAASPALPRHLALQPRRKTRLHPCPPPARHEPVTGFHRARCRSCLPVLSFRRPAPPRCGTRESGQL